MAGRARIPASMRGELYYRIPEPDHEALSQIRDELGMLAQLTFRYCCDKEEVLHIPSGALAQCFARLSLELEEIIEHCVAPSDYEASVKRSRH